MKGWLSNTGIGKRVLLSALIPLLSVTIILGYYMTTARLRDVDTEFMERGSILATNLATSSEYGVFTGDHDQLVSIAEKTMRSPSVKSVTITDSEGGILIQLPTNMVNDLVTANNSSVFNSPIYSSPVTITDFPMQQNKNTDLSPGPELIGIVEVTLSRAASAARQNEILLNSVLVLIAGALGSVLVSFMIGRSVTVPLRDIIHTVRSLQSGFLSARVPVNFGGELSQLAEDINFLAAAVEKSHDVMKNEIQKATLDLRTLVTRLEGKNQELEQARADAVNAGAAKSEFLARMSHEIRTPLSAIIGFSSLLRKTGPSDTQKEYLHTITQAASQLLQIIEDILGYTRLDSNTLTLEAETFNLYETLESVVSILSVLAHEKHLELVLYIHSDVPQYIKSDPNRISQILTNLVNNAIKFTDKGHVIVEVSVLDSDNDMVKIDFAVTDTGIGMSESQLSQIFDPFVQADVSISREYGGTGLGLSISKKLADLLDGNIEVNSQPGKGTTFSFTITTPFSVAAEDSTRRPLTGKRVLVYDHNPFSLRALRNRFLTLGATVFNTSDRTRLLEMIAANAQQGSCCDLLVMGLSYDEYSGIPREAWLKDERRICNSPALVLIGDELLDQPTCLEQERMCILSKPPRSDRLLRQVRKMLSLEHGASATTDTATPDPGMPEDHVCQNILVAEDNRFNQQLFSELLGNLGVHVTVAVNGEEACQQAEKRLFDLVLMDIHMPVMGGIKATQQIRNGKNRLTPIIALTADVFVDNDQHLQSFGLDDILFKPVSEQKLLDILNKWCKPLHSDTDTGSRDTAGLPPGFQKRLQQELGRQLNALRKATDSGDQAQFAEHVHQLKGLVQYFQLTEFTDIFRSLEGNRDAGTTQKVNEALDRLDNLLVQMERDIQAS